MWGDNLCEECEYKQVNDDGNKVTVKCSKFETDLCLYTWLGLYMDAEKCSQCINDSV